MIYVARAEPAPEILESAAAHDLLDAADRHFSLSDDRSEQFEFDWGPKPPFKDTSVRKALRRVFANRCAFCESEVGAATVGIVHHFRPTQEAIGRDGGASRQYYWWLALTWENLYLSCQRCATGAKRRFPVIGPRAPFGGEVRDERALLVDPCRDDPNEHLAFSEIGDVAGLTDAGLETVDVFRLNRADLVDARRREIVRALAAVTARLAEGASVDAEFLAVDRPYIGAVRQNVLRLLAERGLDTHDLQRSSDEAIARRTVDAAIRRQRRRPVDVGRVESITIRNFRAIRDLEIRFATSVAGGAGSWTMLLGENGRGKSSVLQALALALAGRAERDGLDLGEEDFVRHGASRAEITVKLADVDRPRQLIIGPQRMRASGDDSAVAVAGYGAARVPARRVGPGLAPDPNRPRVHNLFHPGAQLIAATQWLLAVDNETFRVVAAALRDVLFEPDATFERGDGTVLLRRDSGSPIPVEHLSDGYRSLVALAVDVMAYFTARFGSLPRAEGIVLVDELTVHLHPRWQMRVVKALSGAFPNLQFVVTTHDPLSLRGMDKGRVVVLDRNDEGDIVALDDALVPPVAGLRVDELLTSPVFGLRSTLDPEVERMFDEYYRLLGAPEGDRDEEQIRVLHKELRGLGQMGRTAREEMVLRAADEYFATEGHFPDPIERLARYEETVERMRRLWKEGA